MENKKQLDLIDRGALGIGKVNPLAFDKIDYAHGWNSAIDIIQQSPRRECRGSTLQNWRLCMGD